MPETEEVKVEEDLNVPFGDDITFESDSFNDAFESTNLENSVEEDLNVPFGDDIKESSEEINIELPDIDSVKEDVATSEENSSDDDIWKF